MQSVNPKSDYTDEQLLQFFKEKAIRDNCIPSLRDITADPDMPNAGPYLRFDGIDEIVNLSGLKWTDFNSNWQHFTDDESLQRLRQLGEELGHPPSYKETDACPYCPTSGMYRNRFGSFRRAKLLAGFNPQEYTKEGLLNDLIEKCHELGRTPTTHEVDADKSMACKGTYVRAFKMKWNQILKLAGVPLNMDKDVTHTNEEIIAQIRMIYEKINRGRPVEKWRAPSRRAYAADPDTTIGISIVMRRFDGSWTNALLAAGIPEEQIRFKKKQS